MVARWGLGVPGPGLFGAPVRACASSRGLLGACLVPGWLALVPAGYGEDIGGPGTLDLRVLVPKRAPIFLSRPMAVKL